MIVSKIRIFSYLMVFIIVWMIFSPVAFFGNFNRVYEKSSSDGRYKVVAYSVLPTTPISLFQSIVNGDVFLVLYDSGGDYVGQSSPFEFSDLEGVLGDEVFFPEGEEGSNSFSINGVNDYVDGYTIPVNEKRWWSRILSFIH